MKSKIKTLAVTLLFLTCAVVRCYAVDIAEIKASVDRDVQPVMAQFKIPGVAVGIVTADKSYVFCYGVSSVSTQQPVTRKTLFEIGSLSKTFTATLADYAHTTSHLSLADKASRYLPVLKNTPFGNVSLLDLGTHTPGGLPLQVPEGIKENGALMQYLKDWRPTYPPGTYRTYSNVSIGTLGLITARSMGQDFATLMEKRLFPALGMTSSFIDVPKSKLADYAQGYTKRGAPIRMASGVLWSEAYGVRSTAPDLLRFLEANMNLIPLNKDLQQAITETHTGYFQAGPMTQDLIWEQFSYPVTLESLLDGNSQVMILNATPVTRINPPESPRGDVWINKTGSTNGFASYMAFIPEKQIGIVILANKNFPVEARVRTAYKILAALIDSRSENRN